MTISKSQFQKFILFQVVLLGVYIGASFFTTALLPPELQTYVENSFEENLNILDIVLAILAFPFLVWALQNLHALYHFRAYARRHLLYITAISPVFYINITQVFVYTNIDAFMSDVGSICVGFTLALVYFSNIASEFEKSVTSETTTTVTTVS